jgi:hypothetical protein
MTDNPTPEERMAHVAAGALTVLAFGATPEINVELKRLSSQLVLLGRWATDHQEPDGLRLEVVAGVLGLLHDGTVTEIVRRIAATLP